jgi:Ca2+-binding RTX toxin-like protein
MSRRSRANALFLESLDARIVPVVAAVFDPTAGVLAVVGDQLDNIITVSRDAGGNILVNGGAVPVAGGTPTVANTTLIRILGNRGNDSLRLDESNGTLPKAVIKGGPGNDLLAGGSGNDTFVAGSGNDAVDGNAGADVAFLGLGDDTFTWEPGDGSTRSKANSGPTGWS